MACDNPTERGQAGLFLSDDHTSFLLTNWLPTSHSGGSFYVLVSALFGRTRPEEWTRQTAQIAALADGSRLEVKQTDQESDVTTVEGARDDDRRVAWDRKLLHLYQTIGWYRLNVQACTCDSLYRTITNFHFCCFRAMAYIRLWNWVQFCLFNILYVCCVSFTVRYSVNKNYYIWKVLDYRIYKLTTSSAITVTAACYAPIHGALFRIIPHDLSESSRHLWCNVHVGLP